MAGRGTNKNLSDELTTDHYVIDEHAVAQAMLNRMARGELPRSAMLISGESLRNGAVPRDEDGTPSGTGLA
jgi:hypothetical protein